MKTAVISGGGSGLGRELAKVYSNEGYHILLLGRTEEKLQSVKEEIITDGGTASILVIDIASAEEVEKASRQITEKYDVELLINNAGVGIFGPFLQAGFEEIEKMLSVNFLGTVYLTKALLPSMVSKDSGSIINIISTAGLRGKKNESYYAASKFALRGFAESLQKEFEESGISIINAYMGGMNTPFWDESQHVQDPSRLRSPREVAEIIYEESKTSSDIIIESKK
ncbi:SDR family NAD(P)-dependent oxidoreductase [Rossellomorea vietnamensis]|uniref:SDR family NAD(P)-dependent oxidoreductase n=2 Tax=Rossellomorea TaxID=2837508 RepID=A0A5D4KEV1_9BACI|nr:MULTISPECIES: SDR family NAD(P)-dependent oxidoreductase [Rossellomorea]TYR75834.1 SDR family NAD(P)-dependent oxidoreductase [Rossellomorea vietnamensis]TYS81041.1 SDR family NAD(P)-dependent oxidoreductase [Rossellomorea aquimaris]